MMHELQFSQDPIATTLSIPTQPLGSLKTTTSFIELMSQASEAPEKENIVEIGQAHYKMQQEGDGKEDAEFLPIKPKEKVFQDPENKKREETTTDTKSLTELSPAQYLLQALQARNIADVRPILDVFIRETVTIIKKLDPINGKQQYQFTFTEPPLKVQFQTEGKSIKIQVFGDEQLGIGFKDLQKHQAELKQTLQKIFPDQDISLFLQEEPSHTNQQDRQNSQQQQQQKKESESDSLFSDE